VIRETGWTGEAPFERAVVVEAGGIADLQLEEFVTEAARWLARERGDNFTIETRRTYVSAGASGDFAQLLITFLGATAGGVASRGIYDALLALARGRHFPDWTGESKVDYYRSLNESDVATILGRHVTTAINQGRSEFELVELVIGRDAVRAIFDVDDGRYEISVESDVYRIVRIGPKGHLDSDSSPA
jgi:hypothetical protein